VREKRRREAFEIKTSMNSIALLLSLLLSKPLTCATSRTFLPVRPASMAPLTRGLASEMSMAFGGESRSESRGGGGEERRKKSMEFVRR
jgi:hypothetical protein